MAEGSQSAGSKIVGGLPPPPGVTPNFVDPDNEKRVVVIVGAVGFLLTSLCVWLRLWTKIRISKSVGWEDYLSLMAWATIVAYAILAFVDLNYGGGVHQWDVPIEDVPHWAELANVEQILYGPLILFIKFSILLQYLRIFVPSHTGRLYYFVQVIVWFNIMFYSAETLVVIFECIPRQKIRKPSTPGHCIDVRASFIVTAVINVISDFSILLLPLKSIWGLHMQRKRKIALSAVFATGSFACIASLARLVATVKILHTKDETFDLSTDGLWVAAEIISGLVCGCLPVLPQFFRHYAPKIAAKLSFNSHNKGRNTPTKLSDPMHRDNTLHPWRGEPIDPAPCSGSYRELHGSDELGDKSMYLTAINGGRHHTMLSGRSQERDPFVNLEIGIPENRIQKTVRIETSS